MEERTKNLTRKPTNRRNPLIFAGGIALLLVLLLLVLPNLLSHSYAPPQDGEVSAEEEVSLTKQDDEDVSSTSSVHITTPPAVRGLYMTSWVAGTPSLRSRIMDLVDETEINALVIDIKDDTGKISFETENELIQSIGSSESRISDIDKLLADLHERNIYVIGRIAVFQDPYLAIARPDLAVQDARGGVWKDRKGLSWLDAGSKEVWDYVIEVARVSHEKGFDEIQFDYIRFPSDGIISNTYYPHSNEREKADVIEEFFRYLHTEMKRSGIVTSADIFGISTTDLHDNNIGQVYERALPYFDYISPMIYPSHYGAGAFGYSNPAVYPGEVVRASMADAVSRSSATSTINGAFGWTRVGTSTPALYTKPVFEVDMLRPWLQDFDLGADYTAPMVRAQINALYDLGIDSWLLWDASNRYTEGALLPN